MTVAEFLRDYFEKIQWVLLGLGMLTTAFFLRPRGGPSQFRRREADTTPPPHPLKRLKGSSKIESRPQLPGFRLEGQPHEILGVPSDASDEQIQTAYRDLMKRFHPDLSQNPSPEQLQFLQNAAVKINDAKQKMLKR